MRARPTGEVVPEVTNIWLYSQVLSRQVIDARRSGSLGAKTRTAVRLRQAIIVTVTDDERYILSRGLAEWGGPAHCTDALAAAMDFGTVAGLLIEVQRLRPLIQDGQPLSRRDWRRLLTATEIVFASDVFGSGWDWSITTGRSDEETIRIPLTPAQDRPRCPSAPTLTGRLPRQGFTQEERENL